MIPDKASNKNPFSAPKGYFERLPEEVITKIKSEQISEQRTTKEVAFPRKQFWTVAASLLLILGISFSLWKNLEDKYTDETLTASYFKDIPTQEYYEYLESSDLHYDELASYLSEDALEDLFIEESVFTAEENMLLDKYTFDELSDLL